MSQSTAGLDTTLLAMQREFDHSFARSPDVHNTKHENFLGIRFGGDAYAIRASEISGLHVDCRIMPMPTTVSSFLGVAGFRGLIAPVFDLAKLLGYHGMEAPRWLILVRLAEPIALAFETFESHFSADENSIVKATHDEGITSGDARRHLHQHYAIRTETATRPIIHLQSLVETIQRLSNTSVRQRS